MKPNVTEVNYRYPKQCCGMCVNAYRNSYGDTQCSELESGLVIDMGGVCDLFKEDVGGEEVGVEVST